MKIAVDKTIIFANTLSLYSLHEYQHLIKKVAESSCSNYTCERNEQIIVVSLLREFPFTSQLFVLYALSLGRMRR